jgi:predicted esterase
MKPTINLRVLAYIVYHIQNCHSMSVMIPSTKRARILCFHGRCQNGSIFHEKISGARRKLQKMYDLVFIDAPLPIKDEPPHSLAWWSRDDNPDSYHSSIQRAMEYVQNHELVQGQTFDVLLGFSQGGTLATALAISGCIQGVRAVVTAGAPFVPEALQVAETMAHTFMTIPGHNNIPKLHLAGEMDTLVPVESTRILCEKAGYGQIILHEQGHLFPTRSVPVSTVLNFLQQTIYQ